MKKSKNKSVFVAALFFVCLFSSCKNNLDLSNNIDTESKKVITTLSETTETEVIYAKDELINKFITEYNAVSKYPLENIKQGNIRTKYNGTANNCWIEITNATKSGAEAFCISINGEQGDDAFETAAAVLAETIKVLNPDVSDEQISEEIKKMQTHEISDTPFGDYISVGYYPNSEHKKCRIDITDKNFSL